jgi:PIN domain nuclease of toxin-antitoxin system
VISSVNHAEVVSRVLERGLRETEADAVCDALRLQILPFTAA